MTPPLVSIIIPCYNTERFVAEAIYSVCDQSYPNIEIIIVDDGSTDNSMGKAIKALTTAQSVRQFRIIPLDENHGACHAVEIGFSLAFGEYAMMLAADDVLINSNYIADAIEILERTGAWWCYASIMIVGEHIGRAKPVFTKWMLHPLLDNLVLQFPSLCEILLHKRNPVNASTLIFHMGMYRVENLSWVRDGDRGVCDGIILKQLFEKAIPGKSIGDVGAFYRTHPGQVSNTHEFNERLKVFRGK